jgi:mannose-6-phosphate isomerase
VTSATVFPLEPAVRAYAWGSNRFLADLQGRPTPTDDPEAEAWFGAHPGAPATATVPGGSRPLDEVIAADPRGALGDDVLGRFGPRLPFLVKILAADAPLSLQAHPSAERAERGFAAEERLGLPRDAPDRNYRDAWPKPELLLALTPFRALCGFRAPRHTAGLLRALAVPGLAQVVDLLEHRGEAGLAPAVAWALRDGRDTAVAALPDLRTAAARVRDRSGAGASGADDEPWWVSVAACVLDLIERYPGDPGTVVALLLRLVELAPGEAIHLPDGVLHAYLGGAGVEVMASSDNVLRGGLTAKHVDVDALLEVVAPRSLPPPFVAGSTCGAERVLATPTPHFRLSEVTLEDGPVRLDRRGPQILIAVGGTVTVTVDGETAPIPSGSGAFVPATARVVGVEGTGRMFRTTVGPA